MLKLKQHTCMPMLCPHLHHTSVYVVNCLLLSAPPQVTESHQSSKKDTSGTAKAIVNSFQGLGLDFDMSQVRQHLEQQFICVGTAAGERQWEFWWFWGEKLLSIASH
jgi:hypothetical protein